MWPLLLLVIIKDVWQVSALQPSVIMDTSTIYGNAVKVGSTTVHQFLGVRYAQPPVGPLRFSKPVSASLPSVVNATTYSNSCPALIPDLPMDEDCLFLSLYVPQSSQEGGVPVMVWFHGGAFLFGSGSVYDGGMLTAEGDVIVVTPNYRLGALGFLSTGDNSSIGNFGLWDQWLALKWVKDNIRHFGGDDTRITIFGESAGAASVSYHMTSPHSQGLFHRAILQSGSRQCPWALDDPKDALAKAQSQGNAVQCYAAESTSALVSCLRGKTWQSLKPSVLLPLSWAPVVDGEMVLPSDQSPAFDGAFMTGVNNREGGLLTNAQRLMRGDVNDRTNHRSFVLETIRSLYPSLTAAASPQETNLAAKILDCVYRRDGSTDTYVTDDEVEEFVGDGSIVVGSLQFLDDAQVTGDKFGYYFDHHPDNAKGGEKGMDHAMDIDYTFGFAFGLRGPSSTFFNRTVSDRERLLGKRFRILLTNFAHSGNPNQPTEIPGWPAWPTHTKRNQTFFSITFASRVISGLKEDVMRVWQETIPGVLRSQGPVGWNSTRWAHCAEEKPSQSLCLSATVSLVLGASVWAVFASSF